MRSYCCRSDPRSRLSDVDALWIALFADFLRLNARHGSMVAYGMTGGCMIHDDRPNTAPGPAQPR